MRRTRVVLHNVHRKAVDHFRIEHLALLPASWGVNVRACFSLEAVIMIAEMVVATGTTMMRFEE